ncbi:hypothetical protein [Polaribacter sp.]|uniref:hypothetical protein n=1 Tax=Polaribacter sp. TaxID=1920175 RepID=UPI003EFAD0F6
MKFNEITWKEFPKKRYRMTSSIINDSKIYSFSRKDVITQFGENYKARNSNTTTLAYSTHEPECGFSLDHPVIVFEFNENGNVERISTDSW